MKTVMKRSFSMLLALVMVFSLTVPAFADDAVCSCGAAEGAEHAADCAITLAAQQQPEANPCTGAEDCGADSHNEGCLSQKQPEPAPAVCTKDTNCTLTEGHSEGCPKAETKQPEQPPVDVIPCTKELTCPAAEHEAECLKAAADKAAAEAAAAEAQKTADIAAVQAMLDALTPASTAEERAALEAAIQGLVDTYGIVPEDVLILDNLYLQNSTPTNSCTANNECTAEDGTHSVNCPKTLALVGDKGYTTAQAAFNAAVSTGADMTVIQRADKDQVIDGGNASYTGTIYIWGLSRHTGEETLTIQNINFTTSDTARYFIDSNLTGERERYAHNVTIQDCTFSGPGGENSVVGARFRQGFDISMLRCKTENMFGALWSTGCRNISVDSLTALGCTEAVNFCAGTGSISNSTITASFLGVRTDADNPGSVSVTHCDIEAYFPVIVRKASSSDYSVSIDDASTLNGSSGYGVVITTGNPSTAAQLAAPTGNVSSNIPDSVRVYPAPPVELAGSGIASDPYLISSVDELIAFRDSVNAGDTKYNAPGVYVALSNSINMAGIDWSVNIGDDCNNTFDGIFDGRNNTISNLGSTETAQKGDGYICTGLFGAIGGAAVIQNLNLNNVTINTGSFTGNNAAAVVGFAHSATGSISNVHVSSIQINASMVDGTGGIVGYAYGGSLNVSGCSVSGGTVNGQAYVGGIIGYAGGTANLTNNSVSELSVNASSCCAGGVAGIMLGGSSASGNSVNDLTLNSAHDNWKNAVGAVAGCFTGTITVSSTSASGNSTDALVGVLHANKPSTPLSKAQAANNNVYYGTLAQAISEAQPDSVITLLTDIEISAPISVTKSLTIEGLEKADGTYPTISYSGTDRAITVENTANGADLTINNLNIDAPNAERGINYNTNGSLTIENVDVTANYYAVNLPGSSDGADVSIEDSKLTSRMPLNIWGTGATIDVTDSDLYSVGSTEADTYAAIQLNNNGTDIADGTVVNVTGGSLNSDGEGDAKIAVNNWTNTGKVNISNSTTVNGLNSLTVAAIGPVGYSSLSDAMEFANGNTIKLLRDVELTETVNVPANATIDAAGYAISKTGSLTSAFSIPGGLSLTVTNWPGTEEELTALVPNYGVEAAAGGTGSFTITGKSGFELLDSDGKLISSYNSLAEAISNASSGSTIRMYQDETTDATIVVDKNLTIDGNGFTLTSSVSGTNSKAITVENTADGANLTVKNLKIDAPNAERGINYNTDGSLTIENVDVTAGNYAVNLPGSSDGADVSIEDSRLTSRMPLNIWGTDATIDVTDSDLYSVGSTEADTYAAIQLNNNGTDIADGTVVTVTGGSLNSDGEGDAKIAVNNWTNTGKVIISNSTTVNGLNSLIVAAIGPVGYSSLSDAMELANGSTIKLLRHVEIGQTINVTANATIDLNGYKISKTSSLASAFSLGEGVVLTLDFDESQTAPMSIAEVKALVPGLCVTNGSYIIKAHDFKYENIEGENKITQTCNNGCDHKAIALIDYKNAKKTSASYTGAEITDILELSYVAADSSKGISSWAGAAPVLSYKDNVDPSTAAVKATGSISIGGASASKSFEIKPAELKSEANSKYYRDSGKSLKFTIETDGKYAPGFVTYVGIYNSANKLVATVPQSSLNAYLDSDKDIVITVPASVMAKLGTGRYTMKAELVNLTADPDDGDKVVFTAYTSCDFRVRYPIITPSTGDPANFLLWGGMLLAATVALGGTLIVLKKSKKQK